MSSRHSLASTPALASASRLSSIDLKNVQGENCEGRLPPVPFSVTPNTRPGPLKICTRTSFAPGLPVKSYRRSGIPQAGSIPLILTLGHYPLLSDIDTCRGANWAPDERPFSRRRGVCIVDGSDDSDVDGLQKWQPRAQMRFYPSVLTHEMGGCEHSDPERNQRCC